MALAGFAQAASINWKSAGYLWDVENNTKAEEISGGAESTFVWSRQLPMARKATSS